MEDNLEDKIKVTNNDIEAFYYLQLKMKIKAVEICNYILKKNMNITTEYNAETDKLDFVLHKLVEMDEKGNIICLDYEYPSAVFHIYIEKEKEYVIVDFPINWLEDNIDYKKQVKEMEKLGNLYFDRLKEYEDRLSERIKREEIHLKSKGDLNPYINHEYNTDIFIKFSELVDEELKKMKKYKNLNPFNFTENLKDFINKNKNK